MGRTKADHAVGGGAPRTMGDPHECERYRDMFLSGANGFILVDPEGTIREWNDSCHRITGISRDRAAGRPVWDVICDMVDTPARPPGLGDMIRKQYLELARTGEMPSGHDPSRYSITHPDGSVRYIENAMAPVRMGEHWGTFNVVRDISAHVRREVWFRGLNTICEELLPRAPLERRLGLITDGAARIFGADFAGIWVAGPTERCASGCSSPRPRDVPCEKPATGCLHLTAASGRCSATDGTFAGMGLRGNSIDRIFTGDGPGIVTCDIGGGPNTVDREWANSLGLRSFAGLKLISRDGEGLGVLAMFFSDSVDEDMATMLRSLAGVASQVIQTCGAERVMRDSLALVHSVMESPRDTQIFSLDREFRYTSFNGMHRSEMKSVHGADIEVGDGLLECIPDPKVRAERKKSVERALAGESFVETHTTPDGARAFELSWNPAAGDGGEVFGITCFMKETTLQLDILRSARESEERYRALYDRSHDLIYLNDFDGNFVDANPAALRALGYSVDELRGLDYSDLLHPSHMEAAMDAHVELYETGKQSRPTELRLRRKDGGYLWVSTQAATIYRDGEPYAIQGIARDITERRRAEAELRRQTLELSLINDINEALRKGDEIDDVIDLFGRRVGEMYPSEGPGRPAVLMLDGESGELRGRNLPVSDEFRRRVEDRLGRPFPDPVVTPGSGRLHFDIMERGLARILDDPEEITALFREYMNSSWIEDGAMSGDAEKALSELAGNLAGGSVAVVPIFQGARSIGAIVVPYSGGFTADETEGLVLMARQLTIAILNKQADIALKESEEKYRAVVQNAMEAIVVAQDGLIRFHNRTVLDIMGIGDGSLAGRPFMDFIFSEDRDAVAQNYARRMKGEDVPDRYEFRLVCAGGEVRWVEISAVLIDWEGRPATLNFLTDITERRTFEQSLRESEERFRNLANLLPQTVFEMDLEGKLTFVNQGAWEMFGYDPEDPGEEQTALQMIAPEDRERAFEGIGRFLAGEGSDSHEYQALRKDGTRFPVRIYSSPVIRDGEPAGLRGIVVDVSEMAEAREALLKSELRFRTIFESSPVGIVIIRPEDLGLTDVNNTLCHMLGYEKEELEGMTLENITHSTDFESDRRAIEQIISGTDLMYEGFTRESRYVRKNGDILWSITSGTRVRDEDGPPAYAVMVIEDITDQRMAEKAILDEKNFSESVVNSLPGVFFMFDEFGRIVRWNSNLEAVSGYSAEEMSRMNALDLFGEEHREMFVDRVEEVFTRGRSWLEANLLDRNDAHVPFYISVIRVVIENTPYQICMGINISDRKAAEKEVRRLNEELEQRVADRTSELEAANRELEAFSYSVSHDLRAPLRSLDGFSLALLEDSGDSLDEAGKGHLDRIRKASQRMSGLIDDMLRLSRITRAEISKTNVDLGDIARSIVRELLGKEPERGVEVDIADTVPARCDPDLLRVVLTNLLGNAWKFTGKRERPRIGFGCEMREGAVTYIVSDNGAGLDMKYAHKLFAPFQRLHSVDDFPGTGIGLAIVKRIINRHGGTIWVESEPGEETRFMFTLEPERKSGEVTSLEVC